MSRQNWRIDNIAQTLHALEHHMKISVYQLGRIWGQSILGNLDLPPQCIYGVGREKRLVLHGSTWFYMALRAANAHPDDAG